MNAFFCHWREKHQILLGLASGSQESYHDLRLWDCIKTRSLSNWLENRTSFKQLSSKSGYDSYLWSPFNALDPFLLLFFFKALSRSRLLRVCLHDAPSSRSPFSRATFSLSSSLSLSRSDIGTNIGQRQSVFTSDPKAWWNDRENGSRTRRKKTPYPRDPVLFTPFYRLRSTRVTKIRFLLKKNDWWDQWADDCWRLRTSLIWDDAAIENWVACVKMTLLYKVMLNSKNISSVGTEKPSLSTLTVSF